VKFKYSTCPVCIYEHFNVTTMYVLELRKGTLQLRYVQDVDSNWIWEGRRYEKHKHPVARDLLSVANDAI
jgi:hypothetical protein